MQFVINQDSHTSTFSFAPSRFLKYPDDFKICLTLQTILINETIKYILKSDYESLNIQILCCPSAITRNLK